MRWRLYHPRADGRTEFLCEHGVGHSPCWSRDRVHGCEGCCEREDFPGRWPRVGDIALCGAGRLGLITCADRQPVRYPDGEKAMAWIGMCLLEPSDSNSSRSPAGGMWSSRNPCILGNIVTILDLERIVEFTQGRLVEGWGWGGKT